MSALALAEPPRGLPGLRLRFERLIAQPAVRRTLPWLVLAVALGLAVMAALALRGRDWTPVYPGLAEADKAAVADALRTGAFEVQIDPATGAVEVPAARVAAARILLAGQGLPKAAPTGATMLEAMPLGTSRAVEGAQLKAAQERDLAASIALIDAVEHATVHLAAPEPSVFIRDHAAPSASVMVALARGRTLSDAQVRAIVHLVASGVAGLDPSRVSVVDQSGTLLTTEAGGELGEQGRMLDVEARTAATVRQRIVALLTPILGRDNFSAQVTADLDFAENAATRESYDKGALASEQGSNSSETPPPPARGIPGALSNTVPQAAQVSTTPPAATPPATPAPTGSSTFARTYEVGKAVSVTRATPGQIRRLSVAVVIRGTALGAAKGQAAQLATLTDLVRGAVGYDQRRGDVVTVAARAFIDPDAVEAAQWWRPVAIEAGQGVLALAGLAMLVFGIGRPWLRARATAAAADVPPADAAPLPLDYTAKLEAARALVGGDTARAAAVVRGMIRA